MMHPNDMYIYFQGQEVGNIELDHGVARLIFTPTASEGVRKKVGAVFESVDMNDIGAQAKYSQEGITLRKDKDMGSAPPEGNESGVRIDADFIHQSNLIENISEIPYVQIAKDVRNKSEVGCVGAWSYIKNKAKNVQPLTLEDVCMVQGLLTEEQVKFGHELPEKYRGKIRDCLVAIAGRIAPIPSIEQVRSCINQVNKDLETIDRANVEDVLRCAARHHFVFEDMHPFADGNGRSGRYTANYILVRCGYEPLIFTNDDKERYYAAFTNKEGVHYDNSEAMEEYFIAQYRLQHGK